MSVRFPVSAPECQLCPRSEYQKTCGDCSFSEDGCEIRCRCNDATGVLQDTVVQLRPSSKEACLLDNELGQLSCSSFCPIETTDKNKESIQIAAIGK